MAAHRKTKREQAINAQRRQALLRRRDQLGTQWAHSISHSLPGTGKLMMELLIVEASLTQQWPHLTTGHAPQWAIRDARGIHNPQSTPAIDCAYCAKKTAQAAA